MRDESNLVVTALVISNACTGHKHFTIRTTKYYGGIHWNAEIVSHRINNNNAIISCKTEKAAEELYTHFNVAC